MDSLLQALLRRRLGHGGPWPNEVYRHLRHACAKKGEDPVTYLRALERRPDALRAFLDAATVSHTAFFRHPEHFDYLRARLPALVPALRPLRVWCAGCSTGQEVWSLAFCLEERVGDWEMMATDVSTPSVEHARRGEYPSRKTVGLPGYDGRRPFYVPDALRARVRFAVGSILEPLPAYAPRRFDLIFCRNLLIYLNDRALDLAWNTLTASLEPRGALVVAPVEALRQVPDGLVRRGPLGWLEHTRVRRQSYQSIAPPSPPRRVSMMPPPPADAQLERAARLLSAGAFTEAEELLHGMLRERDDAFGWFLLAEAFARRGEKTQARIAYERAERAEQAPTDMDLETLRGTARRRARQLR